MDLRARMRGAGAGCLGATLALAGLALPAGAQAGGPPPMRTRASCAVDSSVPSEADQALAQGRYADAELLYSAALKADPDSGKAMAGLVRTGLVRTAEGQDKIAEALALAKKYQAAYPKDADVLAALGEVRFRRGEVGEASLAFNNAAHLDPCNARTHYDASWFLAFYGMYASSQLRINMAHSLSPNDPVITRRWEITQRKPMTAEQQLAWLKDRLDHPTTPLTDDDRQAIEAAIKGVASSEKGSCELVTPVSAATLPIVPIGYGDAKTPQGMIAAGLDVLINGKRKRLEIDTGASGLLLSRSVARAAGLVPELETTAEGFGDQGPASAYVTHVDSIRIGGMEFRNCMVRVLEKRSVLGTDGLIGTDVFRDFVVTLDTPGRELRLGPLPMRSDDPAAKPLTLETSQQAAAPVSVAESARDRYVAPEMKDWTPVFRSDHMLIFPTVVGNASTKLFWMDSGAEMSMITPAAAREVTSVTADPWRSVTGIDGKVRTVFAADSVGISFAGVRVITWGMSSFDSTLLSSDMGAELSGVIGFPTLRELVVSIDYRDNLVHVVYDPASGVHAH
jgi:predicted aspartyl protease